MANIDTPPANQLTLLEYANRGDTTPIASQPVGGAPGYAQSAIFNPQTKSIRVLMSPDLHARGGLIPYQIGSEPRVQSGLDLQNGSLEPGKDNVLDVQPNAGHRFAISL